MQPQIQRVPEADLEHLITPYFKHLTVENVPQSEIAGHAVMETKEVVELRFAGDKNYSPVLPADSMFRKDGHKVITYAERFAEQYAQFVSNADQIALGTPLEKLSEYGITPAQLSLCRAVKVYNIEALYNLDGANLKSLGMHANALKDMASRYMADRSAGSDTARELAEAKAELAALKAQMALPAKDPTPADMDAALAAADKELEAMDEGELKQFIKSKTGQAPRGTPSRDWLINAAKELA